MGSGLTELVSVLFVSQWDAFLVGKYYYVSVMNRGRWKFVFCRVRRKNLHDGAIILWSAGSDLWVTIFAGHFIDRTY